jgi:outer membrane receptor protein involved in Fe transport
LHHLKKSKVFYKKSIFTILISFLSVAIFSQNIQGKIFDGQVPVEFSNVLLFTKYDSTKILKSSFTDSTGAFLLQNIENGTYILQIRMIGYNTQKLDVVIDNEHKSLYLGKINLEIDAKWLKTAEITARKAILQRTPQGFIIKADATLSQAGGTATDLLRNTPTVAVDADGAVTLRGKTPTILINGRPFNLKSTDQLPAGSIESIEIVNNPTAQYDAESEAGIINIKLKKSRQNGLNGAVVLGLGYGAKPRMNSSVLLNSKEGKWNIGAGYDNRFFRRMRMGNGDRVNFNIPEQYYLTQRRNDLRKENDQNLRFNLDYDLNERNSLGFEANANFVNERNDETLVNLLETQSRIFRSKYSRYSQEIPKENEMEFGLNYERKFKNDRKNLTANFGSSLSNEHENTDIFNQNKAENGSNLDAEFVQRTHNYQNTNISNAQLDFAQPLNEKSALKMGYKGVIRLLNSDFESADKINDNYLISATASNIYDFQEQIHATYLQYDAQIGTENANKWKYNMGLRGEQTNNHGMGKNNDLGFDNQYFKLFPNAGIVKYLNENDFLKLSYNRRINRPRLGQLNPFVDVTDSLGQHGGNPNLLPELVNALELGYNKEAKNVNFSTALFYRNASNAIQSFLELRPNGVLITRPQNVGNSVTYGIENVISATFTHFWDANLSFSLYHQKITGGKVSPDLVSSVVSGYGKAINNFVPWKGGKLQIIANYYSPIATPQGTRLPNYNADFGFQQKISKGRGRLGLIVTDVFNTQSGGFALKTADFTFTRRFKVDTRAIMFTYARTFGTTFKEKLMENKFSND